MKDGRATVTPNNQKFMEAFGRQDAAAIAELYTENGRLLPPGSPTVEGKDGIRDFWQGAFGLGFRTITLDTVTAEADGAFICEVGRFRLSGEQNGENLEAAGKYVVVWKDENGWKIHVDIWNSDE